jgi:xylan 1,4-beta-xylosidase
MKSFYLSAALTCLLAVQLSGATYSNPVLPGDYPDPSVIRVGEEYWATATTSEWAPLFPLLRSRDLVQWEHVANVFERRPDWAVGNFWAPEISKYRGTYYVYFVARKRGGPLSISVATAAKPSGPWTDHGPLIAQEAGSIDAVTVVDESGARYMIWKEDGNSRNRPTPLWIQKLSDDGTKLIGEMKEILRNDADWEGKVVEGPFVLKHGSWWYLFYSGSGCCGRGCNYALGIARAKNLFGPWTKNPANPILAANDVWKCPGHGSIVSDSAGRDYLLYHAYHATNFVYVGREGLLDEVVWDDNEWPTINHGRGPTITGNIGAPIDRPDGKHHSFTDTFNQPKLRPEWQWPQNNEPEVRVQSSGGSGVTLSPKSQRADDFAAAVLAVKTTTGDYRAEARLDTRPKAGISAGLAAFGDSENALGLSIRDGKALLWRRQKNKHQIISTNQAPDGATLLLRMTASAGHKFQFAMSADNQSWTHVGENIDLEGNYLPPWDRGIRVALVTGGAAASAQFGSLAVVPATK